MFGLNSPNRLLQPFKGVKDFAEELYAMLSSTEPVERDGPVTIRVKEGQTALRLVRGSDPIQAPSFRASPGRPAQAPSGPRPLTSSLSRPATPSPRSPQVGTQQATQAATGRRRESQPPSVGSSGSNRQSPLLSIDGPMEFKGKDPVRFDVPPEVRNPDTGDFFVPDAFLPKRKPDPAVEPSEKIPEPAIPTNFFATVTGGSGSTWDMQIKTPDDDGDVVSVTILMIDESEEAPVGFGMPIYQIGDDYFGQPPVWLD